ncbi:MAG: chorismate mutase [Clostridia bacterium]|nr:chorismate mutase [Clostridia bacterium]
MTELEKARQIIDGADKEIARLFEERMKAVETVAKFKSEHGLPIFDAEREKAVIEKNVARIENENLKGHFSTLLTSLMDVSKKYQESLLYGMKVAYCGIEGAFAHIAAQKIFPYGRLCAYSDFPACYKAVENGECDCCVLPIENSYAGEVGQVIDLVFEGSLSVSGVYDMSVKQNLVGVKGATKSDIKKVISHPQALMQCAGYIKAHGYESVTAVNTAIAAKSVADLNDKSLAAIAGKETAELYGLQIIDHDINESAVNTTRFAVFTKNKNEKTEKGERFILVFTVNDEVGALAKAVNVICAHGFNMRVLRSRPVKNIPWQYYFYVEADGDRHGDESKKMIKELSACCETLKVSGSYEYDKII